MQKKTHTSLLHSLAMFYFFKKCYKKKLIEQSRHRKLMYGETITDADPELEWEGLHKVIFP